MSFTHTVRNRAIVSMTIFWAGLPKWNVIFYFCERPLRLDGCHLRCYGYLLLFNGWHLSFQEVYLPWCVSHLPFSFTVCRMLDVIFIVLHAVQNRARKSRSLSALHANSIKTPKFCNVYRIMKGNWFCIKCREPLDILPPLWTVCKLSEVFTRCQFHRIKARIHFWFYRCASNPRVSIDLHL